MLLTCVFLACFQSLSFPQVKHPYADNIVDTVYAGDGRIAYGIIIPGKPPENITGPLAEYTRSSVQLQTVPAFNWCFGCTATSAAMAAGYYDNQGYPNMYDGPTNNGVMPMTNAAWSDTVISGETRHRCPLSATGIGLDGRTTRGHIEDYWESYGSPGPDPWEDNGWTEHTHEDCTGDFMKTNQWVNPGEGFNTDASTTIYTWNDGSPMTATDLENENIDDYDGGYGLKLFYESRGYTVTTLFNQKIDELGLTYGYTFEQYCDEIDAGRPVLIHVTDHTMLGYGYNDDGGNEIIYLHDTWDWLDHEMEWGGSYLDTGLDHYAVTVCELQASDINVWTGDYNSYWVNYSNWSLGHVPTSSEDVVIPDNSITCMVDVSSASCNNLDVYPGAVLRLMDETLEIMGNANIHGELEISDNPARLIVNGNIYWENGSTIDNHTTNNFNPEIEVYGTWDFKAGSNVQMDYGKAEFKGTGTSYIRTRSTDSYFHHIRMEKTSGGTVGHSGMSTEKMYLTGNIYIDFGCTFSSYTSQTIEVDGFINILNNSHIQLGSGTLEFSGNPTLDFKPNVGDYVNNLRIDCGSSTLSLDNTYSSVLDVNGFVSIQSGYFDPNGFTINVGGNWYNVHGPSRFIQAGTRVIFDGSGHQYIYDPEDFDTLESQCGAAIRLENSSTTVNVANYDYTTGGWDVLSGTLNVNNLLDLGLWGVWYLNAGGEINVVEDSWLDLNGEIHIYGGTMSCTGNTSYWAWANNALIEMTAGTLDFTNPGIVLWDTYTLTENISGGRIRVNGSFNGSSRSDFTPTGGMFEFYGTANNTINQGAGNNFCFMEINKGSSTVTRDKNVNKAKRSRPDIELSDPRPDVFADEGGSRANTISLGSNLVMTDDLIISTGTLDVSSSNYSITLGGDWTNYVGDAGFNEREGEVRFNGALTADITTSETFYDLVMDKTFANYYGLELNAGSTFTILDDLRIVDGCIEMNPSSDLIVTDSLVISANAGLNANGDTGLEIWVGGHWYNYNTTYDAAGVGFNPGTSTVTFNGSGTQYVYTNASEEDFYDLVIDKPVGIYFRPIDNIAVLGDLNILSGIWHDNTTYRNHYFYGDFSVSATNGGFYSTMNNTVRFMGTGDQYIDFPPAAGGYFYNVIINKVAPADRSFIKGEGTEPASVTKTSETRDGGRAMTTHLSDDLISLNSGYLYLYEGNLDLNGNYYRCTGNVYVYDNATLSIDENAWLEVGGGSDLRVYSGGTLEVIGSSGNEAMVEGNNDLEYDFYVYSGGTISADHAIFEDMGVLGVYIRDGAIVDPTHSFNNCTFRYGSAAAGATLLRIENSQTFTIDGAIFPEATPDADYNVRKTAYDQGSITFTNCTGDFAGPLYEYDTYGRIHWDGQGNWLGTTSSDWNTASNWGFNYIPDLSTDVFIGSGCPNYPQVPSSISIDYAGSFTYYCRSLEIGTGGELQMTGGSMYNYGDLVVDGMLKIASNLNTYSGSFTYVYDTIYMGYEPGYVGGLNMLSGSKLYQYSGSNIYFENLHLHDGCDYIGYGGVANVYNYGSYPAVNTIRIEDENSYFSNFYTENNTDAELTSCTYDLDVFYFVSEGYFSPNGFEITATLMDIGGEFNMASGLITVTGNGPYLMGSGTLNMSGGTIDGGDNVYLNPGSDGNMSGGTISVEQGFFDNWDCFSATGGKVIFNTSEGSGSIGGSPDFYDVDIDKPGAVLESGTEGNGASIYIANNLNIYDGEFELNSGTILDVEGNLEISSGSVLDADDAYPVEIKVGNDWFDLNTSATGFLAGTGSIVTFDGSYSLTALQAVREKSEFNKVVVNSGQLYVRPSGTGNVYIKADTIDVQSGRLKVSGYRIEADERLTISDELEMTSSNDTIIVHDIIWESGSNDVINNGKIFVNGNWRWENGTNASINSGNTVCFNASHDRYIYCYDPDAAFYNLEVENTGSSWLWISSSSTHDLQVLNNMNVTPGGRFVVNENDLTVDGNLDIMSGGWMWMYTDGDLEVATDFGLNGALVLDGGGNVLIHGMFDINSTGYLDMSGGVFCCDASYSAPRGFCSLDGQLDLAGSSILEVLYNHISIGPSFIGNITGGTIRVGGTFLSNIASQFQPSGGTLEFSGGVGGGCYIQMATDNWLNNLLVDGGVSWLVHGSQALHIKKDLTIESGSLNAYNDTIYLGDDWTNNVGATGFSEGTGKVILNGTHVVDVQQINGETFYNLENRNTAKHIEIAGNTTVANVYNGGAGGAGCETFVTASTFEIQDTLLLDQGILALSASAPNVTTDYFDQGGTLQLTNGTFTANDLVENYVLGDYILHNGTINLYQGAAEFFDLEANIEINGGIFNLYGGNDVSYWPAQTNSYSFEMTGGIMNFEDVGIRLINNFMSYDISGGAIRTKGDFLSNTTVSVFDPTGGSVHMLGNMNSQISQGSGSFFHDLVIEKYGATGVNCSSDLLIKNELRLKEGEFNTNGYQVDVIP